MLHLFNVHFGLKIRERAEQVAALVREQVLHRDLSGPRVVIGDLNEWFPGAVGRTLRRELAGPRIRRTHPAPLPIFPLDRIYWDRDLHAEGFRVHRSRLARVASDHLPVVARFRFSPQPADSGPGGDRNGARVPQGIVSESITSSAGWTRARRWRRSSPTAAGGAPRWPAWPHRSPRA